MNRARRAGGCGLLLALVLAPTGFALLAATPAAVAGSGPAPKARRVLVISLPATVWNDLQTADTPNLRHLADRSAVGDLVVRSAGRRASLATGYTAIGAGGRASALDPLSGQAFEVTEPYGDTTAGEAFAQRTGRRVDAGIVQLGIDPIIEENAAGLYGPTIGAFGDALAGTHIPRAVIANGDGAQDVVDDTLPLYQRSAANALMGHDGVVPAGQVSRELLERDPRAPFGVRLDNARVVQAFDRVWPSGGVVLVEASDLSRVEQYGAFETPEQQARQKMAALRRSDALVGALLARVDSSRDAVMLVAPQSPARGGALTVVSLRAPGVAPGLLHSATLSRKGFVSLVDIAPTLLHVLGVAVPRSMEGEVMESRPGGDAASRAAFLVRSNVDGSFRDAHVDSTALAVVGLAVALALATALLVWRHGRAARRLVRWGALVVLGLLAATYLASPLHFGRHGGTVPYWSFIGVVALAFAAVCQAFRRVDRYAPIALALGATVALHVGDMLVGARLELNSVFGYSATVGIRVAGQGNLTYAQVTASAVLLGGILVWRRPSRRMVVGVIAMLAVTLVVMGLPRWGGDFGAALSAAPAFGLFAWLLLGRRIRWRTVGILVVALVASGLAVGFADLLRPADQQTHVGRFFHQVGEDGLSRLFLVLHRKLDENFSSFTSTKLLWILPVVAALLAVVWRAAPEIRRVYRTHAVVRHALVSLLVVAVLGYALNDSGIAIPSLMALVLECVVAWTAASEVAEPVTRPPEVPTGPAGAGRDPTPDYVLVGSRS